MNVRLNKILAPVITAQQYKYQINSNNMKKVLDYILKFLKGILNFFRVLWEIIYGLIRNNFFDSYTK